MCKSFQPNHEDIVLISVLIENLDNYTEKLNRVSKPKTFFNDLLAFGCGGVWIDCRKDYCFLSQQGAIHFRWLSC
jgi:hypothetical protein